MARSLSSKHASDKDLALYALHREDVAAIVASHIASCAKCQQEVAGFERSYQKMGEYLFRVTCPSPETLADYADRNLAMNERPAVEAHLQDCLYCAAEIQATRDFLERTDADLPPRTAATSNVAFTPSKRDDQSQPIRRIAHLLPTAHAFNPAFPLMGSSEESGMLQVFQSDTITIHVYQETTLDGHSVTGLIQQDDESESEESALLARLIHEDADSGEAPKSSAREPEQTAPQCVVVRGAFEFEQVQPSRYHIEIVFPTFVVVTGPITVEFS